MTEEPGGARDPLVVANRLLTGLFYGMFLAILVAQAALGLARLGPCKDAFVWPLRTLFVCGVAFAAVSAIRAVINAPRPYEVKGEPGRIEKDTCGRSFPSRHVFSCFMIACSWCAWDAGSGAVWSPTAGWGWTQTVGVVLLGLGCAMAWIRVRGGVHWPRDVVAGAIVAIALAAIGYWLLP